MPDNGIREFRVTFGMRYRTEPHPTFPQAHPDGWLAVRARSMEVARTAVWNLLGEHWAFIYGGPFDERRWLTMHPAGEIACLDLSLATSVLPQAVPA